MTCFDSLFKEAKGEPIDYQGKKLVRIDRFAVENGDELICSIEKAHNKTGCLQGFCIDVTGYAEMDGKVLKKGKGVRLLFWSDSTPKQIRLKVITKTGSVVVYNTCEVDSSCLVTDPSGAPLEKHMKTLNYWIGGAAMTVEEIENGKRYRCSDTFSTEKNIPFTDIVFTVQKLKA